jgi:hypothetical protein
MDQSEAWPMMPDEWPPKSLLGTRPSKVTAQQAWENHLLEAKERRAKRGGKDDER